MKPSLQLKLGQHLTMTPQLQQAIRLLQLSTLDLQMEIQQTLEENPMLEMEEDNQVVEPEQREQTETDLAQQDAQLNMEKNQELPDELPVDSEWEDTYDVSTAGISNSAQSNDDNGNDFLENQSIEGDTLAEHLLWQLRNMSTSDTDFAIGVAIIDAINDDGYLTEPLEEIHAGLADELDIELDEVEAVLHLIQRFDPLGVGSRNLKECLLLQLEQFDSKTEGLADIRMLIRDHLEQLGSRDYARLLKTTRLSEEKLQQLINVIQSLNPKPGSYISPNRAEYVIPDIYVRKINGEWRVTLNPETAPRIRINPLYAGYVKKSGRGKDSSYLRNSMQEARWFLKSLQSRSDTLLRVGKAIVDRQRLFLEYGDEGMKPMVLRDIAEELDMHESTISRVTTQKYMHTPRGVFEFKFFFSSHVSTVDGGECSATAIRAMVKKLIENENPRKPMSDNKISAFLVKEGINVARRTVAKYREAMSIPPSNERKRLT
ncbi:MAG: RNA polymerase factor sigma-54 [Gammaproteobacteria bacterium]|nr:RNA polymerase factor sigma-54 [Gammaproteobacteria bacterium]NNJ97184.1 RNA polymerase factor sigma-54 [Gammaproteobacteria bacterium]